MSLRVRLELAYDGTGFSGWAAQPGLRTVEGVLSDALATVLRRSQPVAVTVAGRTDAGVHARGQVAHVDLTEDEWQTAPGRSDRPPGESLARKVNGVLPPDVVVIDASRAAPGFDARFSATSRRYRYLIADDLTRPDPLSRGHRVPVKGVVDVAAMDEAAGALLGLRDFAAFCKRRDGATTIRTLLAYGWTRDPDGAVHGVVVADAFCHSMVRALVGAVIPVGLGREPVTFPAAVAAALARDSRVKVMPARGLSLEEVSYPPDEELATRAEASRARRSL